MADKSSASTEVSAVQSRAEAHGISGTLRQLALRGGPIIALVLLSAYLAAATPFFFTLSNLSNVARQTAITATLAVGQTLVILAAGIDLSVGAMAAISASVAGVLMTQRVEILGIAIGPLPFGLGLIIALAVGTLCGMLNGLIITKGQIPDFIATLGTLTIYRGIALLVTGGLPLPSHPSASQLLGSFPGATICVGAGDIY